MLPTHASAQEASLFQAGLSDADGNAVARVVRGIISYTYWPSSPQSLQLCLVGQPVHKNLLSGGLAPIAGQQITVSSVPPMREQLKDCQILYLDSASSSHIHTLSRPGMLTISEMDDSCRNGSMFCLRTTAGRVSFRLNLDAVSRSGLRVDPQVLILGRSGGRIP